MRKPMRSKFCQVSQRRVEKFDHYCPFVGNAIGSKNHHNFISFLGSLIVMNVLFWAFCYNCTPASLLLRWLRARPPPRRCHYAWSQPMTRARSHIVASPWRDPAVQT